MKGIFISYRRDDTASEARLLYNHLRRTFGDGLVFMDVEALREPGADFIDAIHESLTNCDAVLAVMGRHWTGFDAETNSSRLDAPGDFIRMEIAMALQRRVRVIPVLVDGASMPPAETLPEDLRSLTRLQAVTLSHEDWEFHIGKLVDGLGKVLGRRRDARPVTGTGTGTGTSSGTGDGRVPRRWPLLIGGALLGMVALAGVALFISTSNNNFQVNLARETGQAVPPTVPRVDAGPVSTAPVRKDDGNVTPSAPAASLAPAAPLVLATIADKGTVAAAPASTTASQKMLVEHAQRLLSQLGYQPGAADGVAGPATFGAVRDFQSNYGIAGAPGEVNEALLVMLERAATEQAAFSARDISGVWYTDEGLGFSVAQDGNKVGWYLFGVLIGEGTVSGDGMEMNYNIAGVGAGRVVARIDADGRHISGTDSDSNGTVQPIVFHYQHTAE